MAFHTGFTSSQSSHESILTILKKKKTVQALGWSGSSLTHWVDPNFITRVIILLLISTLNIN